MNRCVISGLLSVGLNVLDLRSYPLPLARYAVRVGTDGGVHVRVAPDDSNALVFEFFDHSGIGIDKGAERKVENLFFVLRRYSADWASSRSRSRRTSTLARCARSATAICSSSRRSSPRSRQISAC